MLRQFRVGFGLVVLLALVCLSPGLAFAGTATGQSAFLQGTASAESAPWIRSDQTDYAPASTVTLTSGGWHPNEAVMVFVEDAAGHTWGIIESVSADSAGAFVLTFGLPNSYVPVYSVTAVGADGDSAVTSFTDSVTSISPSSGNEGGASFTLTVNGNGFNSGGGQQVVWTSSTGTATPLATTRVSTTRLTATVPAALLAEEGTAAITVTGVGGGGSAIFTINDQAPSNLVDASLPTTATEPAAIGPISGILTFTDPGGAEPLSDYTATVNWGDGTTSPGVVVGVGGNNFRVDAPAHTYSDEGVFTETVSIAHDALAAVTSTGQSITVADADVVTVNPGGSFSATEGTAFTGPIATFNDTLSGQSPSDFKITSISWGDGTTDTNGSVTVNGNTITINGTHTYADEGPATTVRAATVTAIPAVGTYTIPVTNNGTTNFSVPGTITVVTSSGLATVTYTGKTSGTNTTTFTGCSGGTPGATISGGAAIGQQGYTVLATLAPGDAQDSWTAVTATSTASINDVDVLTLNPAKVTFGYAEGKPGSANPSVSFTDSFTAATAGDFAATIDWGDGSVVTTATSVSGSAGSYSINWPGLHAYTEAGTYTYTVRVYEDYVGGKLLATGSNTILVGDASSVGYYQQSTSVAAASNGAVLPTSTINVAFAFNFPTSGSFLVVSSNGTQVVDYTGKSGNTFTGCTGGTGKLTTGNAVYGTFKTVEGSLASSVTVGHFVEGDSNTYIPNGAPDWTANIHWGDGSVTSGTVVQIASVNNPPQYNVVGSHVYAEEGTYQVSYDIYDRAGLQLLSSTTLSQQLWASVADAQLTNVVSANLPATGQEGSPIDPITGIATFTDSAGAEPLGDYTARISWGDSATDSGTVVSLGGGNFRVDAPAHTYSEEGTYSVGVSIQHDLLAPVTAATQTIVIADPAVNLTPLSVETSYTGVAVGDAPVATFTDPGGAEANDGTHYSATIDWGGVFGSDIGTISATAGTFTVSGSVPYVLPGQYPLMVTVGHEGATPQSAMTTVTILPPPPFSIVPSAGVGGSITPDTTQSVPWGSDSATFTITPDPGYHIVDVSIDGSSTGPVTAYQFTNVTADHTITATFAINTYNVVAISDGNGSVDPTGTQVVNYGDNSPIFTFTPDPSYHVADVLVNGVSVGAQDAWMVLGVDQDTTIEVSFALDTYSIVPTAGVGGTITPDTTQTVGYGADSATFTIAPDPGYHIVDVSIDGSSTGPVTAYQFTNVTADHTISATFAINTYTITPVVIGDGTITPSTTQTVDYGSDSATFTIAPAVGRHLVDVLVDGVPQGPITEYKFTNVTDNHVITAVFAIDTFSIVPSAGAGGSITPNTTQTVDYGSDSTTFTITPDTGYHIVDVSIDGSSTGPVTSYQFTNVTANHTIAATFAIDTFSIVPSAGAGGSITPNTTQTVNYGADSTTFTITPGTGYHIVDVSIDGSSTGPVTSYQFTNVTADHTIAATFAIDTFSIVPTAGSHGSITPDTTQTVNYGADSTTFTITPDTGYHIVDVSIDGSSTGPVTSYKFLDVTANHTIHATFALDTYSIVPTAGVGGTITPDTTQTVGYGADSTTFTITPDTGYHIVDVSIDGSSTGPVTSYKFLDVTANHTIAATFAINTFTLTPNAGAGGSISPSTTQTVDWGTTTTFTITPDAHYHIVGVSVDGDPKGAITSWTFSNVQADHTIAATFAIDTFSIVPSAGSHGSITPNTTQTVGYGSDSASFTITPDTGYHIADVSIDGSSTGPVTSYKFTNVTGDHTIAATFALNRYTIIPSAGGHGSITPNTTQTVDYGSNSVTFTITPDSGYHIADVSIDGSSTGPVATYQFDNVTANHTITATFTVTKVVARLSGINRYATSVATAQNAYPGWTGVRHVIIASGDSLHLPDALTAAGLSGALNAPMLLVPVNSLDASVKAALLAMPRGIIVHVIGGTPSVSAKVYTTIKGLRTVGGIERIAGSDRFGTAAAVAMKMKSVLGSSMPTTTIITSGANGALLDPLIASPVSVTKHFPVLLVWSNSVPAATNNALASLGLTKRYIVGSTATVNDSVRGLLGVDPGDRISGADIAGDAVSFAQFAQSKGWLAYNNVGFAAAVPDAATGGAFMGKKNGPILLVQPSAIPPVAGTFLTTNKASIDTGYLFGGTPTVAEAIRTALAVLIN